MRQYLDFMRHVRDHGHRKEDRTGTGTLSVFGYQMRFPTSRGLPAADDQEGAHEVDHPRAPVVPARRDQRALAAEENGVTIWDEWAGADGELGPIYGYQWRSWPAPDGGHIDQLANVVAEIRRNPDSRRLIVSAWNVGDIPRMALPPCHAFFQFIYINTQTLYTAAVGLRTFRTMPLKPPTRATISSWPARRS